MANTDKRSKKTVSAIQTTVLQMLCRERISEIKIIDLCKNADINRTTFYLHYRGVADVLEGLCAEIVERVYTEDVAAFDFTQPYNALVFLTSCSDVFSSYKYLDDFFCSSKDADFFLIGLKNKFCENIFNKHRTQHGNVPQNAEYIIRFLASGMLDTYVAWLKTDKRVSLETVFQTCAPIIGAGSELLDE